MKVIQQSHEILYMPPKEEILKYIELAGRTCYKSENHITENSAQDFVKKVIDRGHESVIEHMSIMVRFITDRSVTHELVRHRLAAYSQASQRYIRYSGDMEFILPVWMRPVLVREWGYCDIDRYPMLRPLEERTWIEALLNAECAYLQLLREGWRPEQARSVLPNSAKTEIVMTANLREWRHILKLRTSKKAHPQIRELMLCLLEELKQKVPVIFEDI